MNMRFCSATGRMMHKFNPETHQCACGRWERGFKPKTGPVKPRAECQICEGQWALESTGCIGHHGYKRPGCGFIAGDCMGVDHKPYPATDALEKYEICLMGILARAQDNLTELPTLTEFHHQMTRSRKEPKTVVVKKGDEYRLDLEYRQYVPSFDDLVKRRGTELVQKIESLRSELVRVKTRITKAKQ
jgi:hypothetical protein